MAFYEIARELVDRGLAHASENEWNMVVVVLDPSFTLAAAGRLDGAYPSSVQIAIAKAHTALNFGASIDDLKAWISPENQASLTGAQPQLIFLRGGSPIVSDGQIIGAIGVSGGSEAQDVECLEAALAGVVSTVGAG